MEPTSPNTARLEEMIEEAVELSRENNKLLKAMRRDALIGSIVKTLIWVMLIGISTYFSLKFIEPYLGMMQGMTGNEGQMQEYSALFEQYKSLLGQ